MSPSTKIPIPVTPGRRVIVEISADSELALISVFDASLQLRAQGLGSISATLAPGSYKVRYRAGATLRDELVWIDPDKDDVQITGPRLLLKSPLPIAGTSPLEREHRDAFLELVGDQSSLDVHRSAVVLCMRTARTNMSALEDYRLDLVTQDGAPMGHIGPSEQDMDPVHPPGFRALRTSVPSDMYLVRITHPGGLQTEQAVPALGGVTTAFVLGIGDTEGNESEHVLSRSETAIATCRKGVVSRQWEGAAYLSELVRQQLCDPEDLPVLPPVTSLLGASIQANPLLAVLLAHKAVRSGLPLERVLKTFKHPDCDLLSDWIALTLDDRLRTALARFSVPPMLNYSWDRIVARSAEDTDLIPLGSRASEVGEERWLVDPWLVWEVTKSHRQSTLDALNLHTASVESELSALLEAVPQDLRIDKRKTEATRRRRTAELPEYYRKLKLSKAEQQLLDYAFWFSRVTTWGTSSHLRSLGLDSEVGVRRHMVMVTGLPTASIAQLLPRLGQKVRRRVRRP